MQDSNTDNIDLNHYSRQIGTFGMEAMGKLIKLRVFIQGLGGVSLALLPIIVILDLCSNLNRLDLNPLKTSF